MRLALVRVLTLCVVTALMLLLFHSSLAALPATETQGGAVSYTNFNSGASSPTLAGGPAGAWD